jgi:hypothetical protein
VALQLQLARSSSLRPQSESSFQRISQRVVVPPAALSGGVDGSGLRGRTAEPAGSGVAIGGMRGGGPLCLQCVSRTSGMSAENTVAAATPEVRGILDEPACAVPSEPVERAAQLVYRPRSVNGAFPFCWFTSCTR